MEKVQIKSKKLTQRQKRMDGELDLWEGEYTFVFRSEMNQETKPLCVPSSRVRKYLLSARQ